MVRAMVRAIRGNRDGARADGTEVIAVAERIGWPHGVAQSRFALGFLSLSEGDPIAARGHTRTRRCRRRSDRRLRVADRNGGARRNRGVCCDRRSRTGASTHERARRLGPQVRSAVGARDFGLAVARSLAAATGDLESAAAAAAQALVDHQRLPMPFELGTNIARARTTTAPAWRSDGRDAKTLRRALTIFEELGAPLWAEMARREIARIGVRRAPEELTEGEKRVAEMAAQGLNNPEIAARLFMSRRTVEANLARAYSEARHPLARRTGRGDVEAQRSPRIPAASNKCGNDGCGDAARA